ncbi:ribose-5-phosphate isomerase RpiA [Planococcus sp. N028]|uniref:Ribose-5-phosphate isomerase A n=1 Tax=Planococcus shixiaomingii TaxID=3058393 RepID=A0ABT8N386_9BACL|nr:ribose-5-phosphate isomerase RpiA [Planococcus sp. N028]MDN7242358.1 ribose-5-phosphate isomerase RpiA [Planococcus sp. N028]
MEEKTDLLKKAAGEKAAEYIEDGMVIGLGSGSTVYWMLKKLGEKVEQGLNIKGIPTSLQTEGWAKEFQIPLTDFSEVHYADIAIDGTDEIDPDFNMIKGGGGALVREKIVASSAEKLIIIADESKVVDELGKFPLPIEVLPFGWQLTAEKIAEFGAKPVLRKKDGRVFISDNGNYILDCGFESIPDPGHFHKNLKQLLGVVETGLFVGMTDLVILAGAKGVKVLNRVKVQNGEKTIDSALWDKKE